MSWIDVRPTDTYRGKYRLYVGTCPLCMRVLLRTKNNFENSKCCASCRIAQRGHGMVGTATYNTWRSMLERCENPRSIGYANYGGRGISVCQQWHSFREFLADMGERPAGTELDRTDNSRGYTPDNCRWVPRSTNALNRRNANMITLGDKTQNLSVWARDTGLSRSTIRKRLARGLSPEKALSREKQR